MKTIQTAMLVAGLSLLPFSSEAQSSWDFQFAYENVFFSNALQYVVEQQNIQQYNNDPTPGVTYWCPVNNGTEAILTQKFTFPQPTSQVFLSTGFYIANFGGGEYGSGSLWGSIDGTNWVLLVNGPTPSITAYDPWFTSNLPNSLIGSTQLWIQAQMESSGWNIMAQFNRENSGATNNMFELDANYITPQVTFVKAFTVDYSNLLIGSNYQAQASSNMISWTNWGAAFTATNSSYTNTNYQRIANWNQLFFRLVQQ